MIKVKDPKQNKHSWCGTLAIDQEEKQTSMPSGDYVFLKTSRDAHFVAQGVVLGIIRELTATDIDSAIKKIIDSIPDSWPVDRDLVADQIRGDIKKCVDEVGNNNPVVEILVIDKDSTDPLPNELSLRTEFLFRDDMWLDRHGEQVGAETIRIGRLLPCLPTK